MTRKEKAITGRGKILTNLYYDWRKNRSLLIMISIPVLLLIVFSYVPLYGLLIAFKDYNVLENIWDAEWVGLQYFKRFFEYYDLKKILKNTIMLNGYDLLLTPIPLLYAICIHYFPNKKIGNIIQTVAVTPHFISVVVICSLAMKFLSTEGLLNEILCLVGHEPENYLLKGELFSSIYVWSGMFQNMGFNSIIFLSALSEIPRTQYEAAEIDGANILDKIRYIDLPNIAPLFAVDLAFRCGALLNNNYEKILLLQNKINMEYSEVLSSYVYEVGFGGIIPQYSYATAIGIIVSLVNIIMFLIIKRVTRRWEKIDE